MRHCGNTWVEQTHNKSQHTKLTLEKKILSLLLPGFKLATFRSRVWCSNQQAIPAIFMPGVSSCLVSKAVELSSAVLLCTSTILGSGLGHEHLKIKVLNKKKALLFSFFFFLVVVVVLRHATTEYDVI